MPSNSNSSSHPIQQTRRRFFELGRDEPIATDDLPAGFKDELFENNMAAAGSLADTEADVIRRTLAAEKGNLSAAARRLGIDRSTLYRKLKPRSPK